MKETSSLPPNKNIYEKMRSEHSHPDHRSAAEVNSKIGSASSSRESSPSINSPSSSEQPQEASLPPFLTMDMVSQMQLQQLQVFQSVLQLQQAHHNKEIQRLKWQLDTQALITSQAFSALEVSTSQANEFLRQLNTRAKDHQSPGNDEGLRQSSLSKDSAVPVSASNTSERTYPLPGSSAVPAPDIILPQLPSISLPNPYSTTQLIDLQRNASVQAASLAVPVTTQAPYTTTSNYSKSQPPIYVPLANPESYNYQLPSGSMHTSPQCGFPSVPTSVSISGQHSGPPATQPSGQPSGPPSTQPSGQSTGQPSGQQPLTQPPNQSARQPATQPSIQPSTQSLSQPPTQSSSRPSAAHASHPVPIPGNASGQTSSATSGQDPEKSAASTLAISSPINVPTTDVPALLALTDMSRQPILPPVPYPDSSGYAGRSHSVPHLPTSPQSNIPVTELRSHSYQFPSRSLNTSFYSKENHIRGNQAKVPILGVKESRYQMMLKRKRKMAKAWKIVDPSDHRINPTKAARSTNDPAAAVFPSCTEPLGSHRRNHSQSQVLPRLEALMLPHYQPTPQPQGPKDTDYQSFYNIPRPTCLDPLPPPILSDKQEIPQNTKQDTDLNLVREDTQKDKSKPKHPFLGNSPRYAHDYLAAVVGPLLFRPLHDCW